MNNKFDVAVIGAGIVGLSAAWTAAKKGKKVVVFERNVFAAGASVRNFGLIWPIGQKPGNLLDRALFSRSAWLELKEKAGVRVEENGSLHLAYHEDEWAVLNEFMDIAQGAAYQCRLLPPDEVGNYSAAYKKEGLTGALWSQTELTVSPRQAIPAIAHYLAKAFGVEFIFNTAINHVETGAVFSFDRNWRAKEIFVCSGVDFETLYPVQFGESGITKCKLQMMSTVPQPNQWKMGASLCAGLTLRHYDAFSDCPSLKKVSDRYDEENLDFKKYGVHVLLSQNAAGQLIIGDSHEYGLAFNPFDKEEVNLLILEYLKTFTDKIPQLTIAERWHGVYPKLAGKTDFILRPEQDVTIINGLSGAGMTLSFGLANRLMNDL